MVYFLFQTDRTTKRKVESVDSMCIAGMVKGILKIEKPKASYDVFPRAIEIWKFWHGYSYYAPRDGGGSILTTARLPDYTMK